MKTNLVIGLLGICTIVGLLVAKLVGPHSFVPTNPSLRVKGVLAGTQSFETFELTRCYENGCLEVIADSAAESLISPEVYRLENVRLKALNESGTQLKEIQVESGQLHINNNYILLKNSSLELNSRGYFVNLENGEVSSL
ncbi:MAG: hypothetical protein KDD25_01195 [Bdellovibrionales bacterium]|nr:hypothetical protein [Bdellovibrionales bacterium]